MRAQKVSPFAASFDGAHLCTIGADKSAKVYDVLNFDMMHMLKLDFTPFCCEWIYRARACPPCVCEIPWCRTDRFRRFGPHLI